MKLSFSSIVAVAALGFVIMGTNSAEAAELPKDANTTCPIMQKEASDPDLFVDYKGERVYLCCTKCKKRFAKDPDKYLQRVKAAKAPAKTAVKANTQKSATTSL